MTANNSKEIIKGVRRLDDKVVLDLAGEIDMRCSVDLRGTFMELLESKPTVLVVNMNEVEFMDSSGLATLVEALQWCRRNSGELRLYGLQKRVRSIFEISRLESIFKIYENEAEALA